MSKKMNMVRGAVAGAIALLLVACAGTVRGPDISPASIGEATGSSSHRVRPAVGARAGQASEVDNRLELRAFLLANRERREAGKPALDMRYDLVRLARQHARDMADRDFFSHYNPDGEGPGERAREAGVRFVVFGENLARVRHAQDPARLAVKGWMESPGHRRNLLDESGAGYRYTGVGVVRRADGAVLFSQVFLR